MIGVVSPKVFPNYESQNPGDVQRLTGEFLVGLT